jgi:hypothetical protein
MFLGSHRRIQDGKEHRYYSIEESRRLQSGPVVQRRVRYLGEIHDSQPAAWRKTLEVFDEQQPGYTRLSLVSGGPAGSGGSRGPRAGPAPRDEAAPRGPMATAG